MYIKKYELFFESKSDIDSICYKYGIRNYTINDDGAIDVDGSVNLTNSELTKLPLKFGKVTGDFNCLGNQLTSLEGSPYWVGKDFSCSENNLETLEGCPKWIGGNFSSTDNNLKTLEGGPEVVIGSYYCSNNQLVNFKGFPEDYENDIFIHSNPVSKLLIDIPRNKENKFIYWCNELNVIDDNGNVNDEWMEEVYHKLGLKYEN